MYKFVASLHLFSDVLPVLTQISKKFQADLNFAQLKPSLDSAIAALQVLKETPGPFFSQTVQEDIIISVNDAQRASFDSSVRNAYLHALLDSLLQRFPEMPLLSALQIFDPRNLPARE